MAECGVGHTPTLQGEGTRYCLANGAFWQQGLEYKPSSPSAWVLPQPCYSPLHGQLGKVNLWGLCIKDSLNFIYTPPIIRISQGHRREGVHPSLAYLQILSKYKMQLTLPPSPQG